MDRYPPSVRSALQKSAANRPHSQKKGGSGNVHKGGTLPKTKPSTLLKPTATSFTPGAPVATSSTSAASTTSTAYVAKPPFEGYWDKLTTKFGLPKLDTEGFINYEKIAPGYGPVPKDFTGAAGRVHPIFAQSNWLGINYSDWILLQPAIQLASAFLTDPAVMMFFAGVMDHNLVQLNDPAATVRARQVLTSFEPNARDLSTAYLHLQHMGTFVTWEFIQSPTSWANTTVEHSRPFKTVQDPYTGQRSYTTAGSSVRLTSRFLDTLRGMFDPTKQPRVQKELQPYDKRSAFMRSTFFLGVTMMHELCHAWGNFVNERRPNYPTYLHNIFSQGVLDVLEPFFRDDRISELGHAYEQLIFGGNIELLGNETASAPYGLATRPFPGNVLNLGWPRANPTTTEYLYGCKMTDLHRFFEPAFWGKNVHRFGLQSFNFDRTHDYWAELAANDTAVYIDHGVRPPTPPKPPTPPPKPMLYVVNP